MWRNWIKKVLEYINCNIRAFYSLLTIVLHILHREMRVNLKIIHVIVIERYSNYIYMPLYSNINRTESTKFDKYVKDFENRLKN